MKYQSMADFTEYSNSITAESLGSNAFRERYASKYAYVVGAMYKGISSKELVVASGKSGILSFFGTGGISIEKIAESVEYIQERLEQGQPYGMNLLNNIERPELEMQVVNTFLEYRVRNVEAAAYMQITAPLVKYRVSGLRRNSEGNVEAVNQVMAKVSRPEVAEVFMRPPPKSIIEELLKSGQINEAEALMSREIPVAHDICVESDSGGHTDQGNAYVLVPAIRSLSIEVMNQQSYSKKLCIGAAGGIGTPEAAAAAFILGADFVLTGSINQCTVEAATSDEVKNILQNLDIQDTGYSPAGDMFEIGAKMQVVKRGTFFPARANKLYELYLQHDSIDELDSKMIQKIQNKYFKRSIEEVWSETKSYYKKSIPHKLEEIENNPKKKMASIFRWYFVHSTRLAMKGVRDQVVDYQIHCGPALGAFNRWVKGTELEDWRNREVAQIGKLIMHETASFLEERVSMLGYKPV